VAAHTAADAAATGQGIYNAIVSKYSLKHFHRDHGYYDMDNLTPAVLDYEWTTGHQPGARFAPASFVTGFLDPEEDLGVVLGELDVPITLVWGRNADISPLENGRELADEADARLVVFDESLLLPHVEHPDQFVDVVRGAFRGLPARKSPGNRKRSRPFDPSPAGRRQP